MSSKHEVTVNGNIIRIESFSARKGLRILRLLEHTAKGVPEIQTAWANYTRDYEATHTIDLDRAMARSQYPPSPLLREEPVLIDGIAQADANGRPLVRREPMFGEDGKVLVGPDPLGHITEADWAASGNKLREPKSPSSAEQIVAVLPLAIELAEDEVAKLLGLIAMTNSDVKRYGKENLDTLWEKAAEYGDEILEAPMEQVVELAVVAGECVQETYMVKVVERLGERLTSIARLVGMDVSARTAPGKQTSSTEASTTSPTSSTDSPEPTDGAKDEPSTEPASVVSEPSLSG
jgi:hypothetical protein